MLRRGDRIDVEDVRHSPRPRCANIGGVSLHANVAVPARDRKRLERLCRYVARPPIATDVKVYFCDPQSPWQRGTNENTNRLLRQYFPKGTDLSACSQADLNRIALQLNQRPRKTLDFHSPAEVLNESVALTG